MSIVTDQKREAEAVKAMLATPGWKILEEYLINESNTLMTKLIDEDDAQVKTELQKDIRSIKKLLNKIMHYDSIAT